MGRIKNMEFEWEQKYGHVPFEALKDVYENYIDEEGQVNVEGIYKKYPQYRYDNAWKDIELHLWRIQCPIVNTEMHPTAYDEFDYPSKCEILQPHEDEYNRDELKPRIKEYYKDKESQQEIDECLLMDGQCSYLVVCGNIYGQDLIAKYLIEKDGYCVYELLEGQTVKQNRVRRLRLSRDHSHIIREPLLKWKGKEFEPKLFNLKRE